MALQLRRTPSTKVRLISTLIAVLALVMQPTYGLLANQVAHAANDTTAPTVTSVTVPANATYTTGQNLDFTVNFDENVTVHQTSPFTRLDLFLSTSNSYVSANYLSGSGTSALTFRYTVASGDSDSDGIGVSSLQNFSGALQDASGNDANRTLNNVSSTSGVLINFTAPTTAPTISLDTYFKKDTYKGIGVDIKVNHLTDATGVKVEVNRTTGGSIVKTAKTSGSVLSTLNTGASAQTTAPIVVQNGTYNEAGSGSWNMPVGSPWTSATTPSSVTVTITRADGSTLVATNPIGATMGPFATLSEVMPAPVVCSYDFPSSKQWEVTWGYDFAHRNGGAPIFNMQSNGGLVSLNGGAVPIYMTSSWHWLYVTEGVNSHYNYGFADGTTRTVDVTFSDVNGCQVPTIMWGVIPPDAQKPTGVATYDGGNEVGGVRYIKAIDDLSFTATINDNQSVVRASYTVTKLNTSTNTFDGFCGNWNSSSASSHTLGGSTHEQYTAGIKNCAANPATWTNGTYRIGHAGYDAAGNEGKFNADRQIFVIDSTAPDITPKTSSVGSISHNVFKSVDFKLHDSYKVSRYKVNDGAWHTLTPNTYSDANGISVGHNGGVYGTNTVTVEDLAGNQGAYTFVLDNVNPDVTPKSSSVGSISTNTFSKVDFKLHDQYMVSRYKVNNGAWHNVTPNTYSDANDISVGHNGGILGANTITLEDLVGNSVDYAFTLDNVSPIVTITTPVKNDRKNGTVTVSGTATDSSGIGNDEVTLHLRKLKTTGSCDGFLNTLTAHVDGSGNWTTSFDSSAFDDGDYCITVLATDVAGNGNGGGATLKSFTLDNTLPTGDVTYSPDTLTNGNVLATLITSEPVQDISGWLRKSDTKFQKAYPKNANTPNYDQNITITDLAGNTNAIHVYIDWVDITAPVLTTTVVGGTVNGTEVLDLNATEAHPSIYNIRVLNSDGTVADFKDGTAVPGLDVTGSSSNSVSYSWDTTQMNDGDYLIQFSARDGANNSATSLFRTLTVDNTGPAVTVNTPAAIKSGDALTLTGDAGDAVSVTVTVDGNSYVGIISGTTWSLVLDTSSFTVGSHPITVSGVDALGNASTVSSTALTVNSPDTGGVNLPLIGGRGQGPLGDNPIVTQPQNRGTTTTPTASDSDVAVLGTKDTKTPLKDTAVITPSSNGWKIFGFAWYWWLLLIAAVAAIWWFLAARRRRAQETV